MATQMRSTRTRSKAKLAPETMDKDLADIEAEQKVDKSDSPKSQKNNNDKEQNGVEHHHDSSNGKEHEVETEPKVPEAEEVKTSEDELDTKTVSENSEQQAELSAGKNDQDDKPDEDLAELSIVKEVTEVKSNENDNSEVPSDEKETIKNDSASSEKDEVQSLNEEEKVVETSNEEAGEKSLENKGKEDVITTEETNTSEQNKGEDDENPEDAEVKAIMGTSKKDDDDDDIEEIIDDDEDSQEESGTAEVISLSSSSSGKKEEPDVVDLSDDSDDNNKDDGDDEEEEEVESESEEDEGDPSKDPGEGSSRYVDPDHLLPFKHGWKREVVKRPAAKNSASQCDVYYWPPTDTTFRTREAKRKRRSKLDQEKYFEDFPSDVLSVINFNYVRRPLGLNNSAYEIIRKSRTSGRDNRGGRRGVSYKEVPETRGLMQDDSDEGVNSEDDIDYKEGLDMDIPVCLQIKQHVTGLRGEHKKRRKVRDPETCCTPPLAEDMLWNEMDEDPLGVYNQLGGRSSPATPPPLRALKVTFNETADKILKAIDSVREEAKKTKVTKEQDLTEELASHDVAIRKFKDYVDKGPSWFKPGISSRIRNLQGNSFSQGRRHQNLITPSLNQFRPNSIMSGGGNNMVKIKLPMKSLNGKRPVVELVMEQNGRYQPIKFSNNMQVTECIHKTVFEEANRRNRVVHQKARQVPRVGNRQLYLAINPSSDAFLKTLVTTTSGPPNPSASSNHRRTGGGNNAPSANSNDQVAILVRPQKGPNPKPVLLNVPRKIALKVKNGTTLSFSASNDQKYVVLDSKIHPPVGNSKPNNASNQRQNYNSNRPVQGNLNGRSRQMPPQNHNRPIQRGPIVNRNHNNPLLNRRLPLNLPSSVTIRPIPNPGQSQNWRSRPVQNQGIRRPHGSGIGGPPNKTRKVLSTGEVIGQQAVVTPCTPYCPGVSGFPELECNGCQSLFHSKCVGIPPMAVNKVKSTFKCKMCAVPRARSQPTVINLD